jgi:hypothetical protein
MLLENVLNGNYQTDAAHYQSIVNNAISTDTNKLFTYAQFQNGLISDIVFGGFTIPGISNLLEARKTYLQAIPELAATEPTINRPVMSNNSPLLNSVVNMSVAITNATITSPYVGYRFNVKEKFTQLPLYDDGAHNDGTANDGVFGTSFTMTGATMQYYVYAENDFIGKFLPARAEHEYLIFQITGSAALNNEVVINEILCENSNKEKDEYGANEDWIELHNKTNELKDLSNLYLSNNISNLKKWKFPMFTQMIPHSYLTI